MITYHTQEAFPLGGRKRWRGWYHNSEENHNRTWFVDPDTDFPMDFDSKEKILDRMVEHHIQNQ